MDFRLVIASVLSGYLLGAISFARIVSRIKDPDFDVENVESPWGRHDESNPDTVRTISATTASMKFGGKVGCLIGWLDMFKVAIPTLVFKLLFPDQPYFLFAATTGMAGHIWPLYYKFKGGGGISSIYGAMFVIDWLGAIVCAFAGMFFGTVIVRKMMIAYQSGVWFILPWLWIRNIGDDLLPYYIGYGVIINILFVIGLLPEIRMVIAARKAGVSNYEQSLQTFPMGRGMAKIEEFLKLKRPEG